MFLIMVVICVGYVYITGLFIADILCSTMVLDGISMQNSHIPIIIAVLVHAFGYMCCARFWLCVVHKY